MRDQLAVVAANTVVLFATYATFRAWVAQQFGYLDLDAVGLSTLVWPLLAVAATASTWLGFHLPQMRFVAAFLVGALALIVVDQAAGALRDGSVSPEGVATGVLMGVQCLTLAVGIGLAARPRRGLGAPPSRG